MMEKNNDKNLEKETQSDISQQDMTPPPHLGDSRKKKPPRRGKNMFFLFIIICCILFLCIEPFKSWQARRQQEELRRLAEKNPTVEAVIETTEAASEKSTGVPAEPEQYLSPIDFEELRKVNPDVIAWLTIPGTNIDYPVVQTTDNETYLSKTFEGGTSVAGSIFLDSDSRSDLMGLHSILYGHHMKNKTMFTDLIKFKDEEFFNKHREIILYTPERELHLQTVAALYGDADGEKRRTKFSTQERFNEYVDIQTKGCGFRELPEGDIKHLYSFVTCSYEFDDARTILYAVYQEN